MPASYRPTYADFAKKRRFDYPVPDAVQSGEVGIVRATPTTDQVNHRGRGPTPHPSSPRPQRRIH